MIALAPVAAPGGGRWFVALSAMGVPLTLIACTGRRPAATWAVVALGAGYAGSLLGREIDQRAALIAGGLLVLSELIDWSLRARSAPPSGWSDRRRLVELGIFGFGSIAIGAIAMMAGSVGVVGGVALAIVGVLASTAILGLILLVASGSRSGPRR